MKHYLITIKIRNGDYEKTSRKLIIAASAKQARKKALTGEMHHDFRNGSKWIDPNTLEDGFGEWIYSVTDTKRVSPYHAPILEKYLFSF